VGKTAFINRHRTGAFDEPYVATMGVEVVPLTFYTTKGPVVLHMWDCPGKTEYAGLGDYYWSGADGAILMFDVGNLFTYRQIPALHRAMMEHSPDLPVVLCGNKVDCRNHQVKPEMITYHRTARLRYYDTSARSCYNFEKPVLYLLRKLMGDSEPAFVETTAGPSKWAAPEPLDMPNTLEETKTIAAALGKLAYA
jgi:GTP-binding nuclear protein Ran